MKYSDEMGSHAMRHTPSFTQNDSGIQKLMEEGGGGFIDIQRAWRSHQLTSSFSK
jgi:hypothetical protein